MKVTLTKKVKFDLQPFGKFVFKFTQRYKKTPNTIHLDELQIKHNTAMPMTEAQEEKIVALMKKNKTDVLTDGDKFYTRTSYGLVEIYHSKLALYKDDIAFKDAVDNGRSF